MFPPVESQVIFLSKETPIVSVGLRTAEVSYTNQYKTAWKSEVDSIFIFIFFSDAPSPCAFNMYVSDSRHDSKVMTVSLMEVGHHQKHDKCGFVPMHSCLISNKSGEEKIIRQPFTKNKPISVYVLPIFCMWSILRFSYHSSSFNKCIPLSRVLSHWHYFLPIHLVDNLCNSRSSHTLTNEVARLQHLVVNTYLM
jgi:hypothetical protein